MSILDALAVRDKLTEALRLYPVFLDAELASDRLLLEFLAKAATLEIPDDTFSPALDTIDLPHALVAEASKFIPAVEARV